ncbi:MAG TPA: FUSC family protein [Methylocella sp.]|nr:FUSC family protein [Methylocella sp.]
MKIITTVWTWIRIQIRDLRPQLRLCLRVTAAALLSFVLGKSLNIPLGGLWAVLTAVVVTQTSVGGSLKATIEYLTGTLGGAVYAGVIAVLLPPANEISLLIALAIAVAPLALLAAINTNFRVAPFTAVIVVVGSSVIHAGPVDSAFYRVIEVAIGGVIGLAVSLLVFPARAYILMIEAAACMLDLMAGILPELLIGITQTLDEKSVLRKQDRIGQAFTRLTAIAAEAMRERMAYLASAPDPGPLLHTLLSLRHDIVMIGRAAVVPLSEPLQARLGPPLARAFETAADYLRGSSGALIARRNPPPLDAVDASFDGYGADIAALRLDGLTRGLPGDAVERLFALGFALEQTRRDFEDLEQCVKDYARSTMDADRKRGN